MCGGQCARMLHAAAIAACMPSPCRQLQAALDQSPAMVGALAFIAAHQRADLPAFGAVVDMLRMQGTRKAQQLDHDLHATGGGGDIRCMHQAVAKWNCPTCVSTLNIG